MDREVSRPRVNPAANPGAPGSDSRETASAESARPAGSCSESIFTILRTSSLLFSDPSKKIFLFSFFLIEFLVLNRTTLRLPPGLRKPDAIQRFLDEEILYNKEPDGETAFSPKRVLAERRAHCFEGALFAAAALRRLGHAPLVVQLRAVRDDDHVLALYRERPGAGCWGAVAKSNYSGLRFRSAVYRTLRELAMSYFDVYYNLEGEKSLRAFGRRVNMARFDAGGWETAEDGLWDVSLYLATRRFTPVLSRGQAGTLTRMDRRLFDAGLVGTVT
jgi:hypothetical protein